MKFIKILFCAAMFALSLTANAATWNDSYNIGDGAGQGYFSASGVPFTVIPNVQSNSLYIIQGGAQSLAPRIGSVWIQPDLTAGTLRFYLPTNTYTCASNQPAGTNIVWLNSTNSGLSTNDVLILQNPAGDAQLVLLSGNATSGSGLVYTNAAGYTAVKLWNTPTNTITAGAKLYKMALVQSFTPLALQNATNDVAAPWGNYWQIATRAAPLQFFGERGVPCALVMTYSNAAGFAVTGDFKYREQ